MASSTEIAVSMTGSRPAGRLGQFSWALFDWANQPFFTLITTFIFAPYFTGIVVGDPIEGQALWGYTQGAAGAVIAILAPILGAVADASGPRKPWIFGFQAATIVGCWLLWYAMPGAPGGVLPILIAVAIATIGAEFAIVFNNAMLPSLTSEARIGRLSGNAWALGYVGGLLTLFFVLLAFGLPEKPMFGLDKANHEHDRIVGPLSAIWIAVFIVPLFLFTPDQPRSRLTPIAAARVGLCNLAATLRRLGHYRNVALFLVARMLYIDGLFAIFAFGGIYAQGIFGWDTTRLGIFGIILLVFAAVGALVGGWLDDRFGSKRTVLIVLVGAIIATGGVLSISVDAASSGRAAVLFFLEVGGPGPDTPLFGSTAERVFLLFGILLGISGGPIQAASRTMVSRLAPLDMIGEFYGLFALSGKVTAFLAPLAVAIVTGAAHSQRLGISTIFFFLAIGYVLLLPVREERSESAH